ncbi:MAG: sulfite exporter TauE/SafE family protein [Chitinophagaceae bacterium]|nr:sulfite exporter TauE/SafE family protein [Chitinophagaceae bacterium]
MQWPLLISGFTLGLAGSLHCIGMCGPLSLALPTHHLPAIRKFISLVTYQFGRIITYSCIGLVSGTAGRRIFISGYQQWFSIGMGILILCFAVLYFSRKSAAFKFTFVNRYYASVQKLIVRLLHSSSGIRGFLLLGMANGLLPCGMVYVALATAFSFTEVFESVFFMAMFGAGTLPAMMFVAYALQKPFIKTGRLFKKLVPFFMVAMAVLLILRGMNLGIPFISPQLPGTTANAAVCHP